MKNMIFEIIFEKRLEEINRIKDHGEREEALFTYGKELGISFDGLPAPG